MALAIGAGSLLVFAWFVTVGRGDLTQSRVFSDVFDLQARAILQRRLSVPDGSLAFEGFVIDGRTYAYFGIFPSLIRLPVLVLTDRFDGELTAVSMLVAYVVAFWSTVRIVERTHRLLRPATPWTGTGLLAAGLLLAVAGAGSNLVFLASAAWVYHEAALWGAAGVLASFAATLRFVERPGLRSVVAAGAWAAVAWTSRGSVGLAPSIVLGLLGLAHLTSHRWLLVLVPPPERSDEDGPGREAGSAEPLGEEGGHLRRPAAPGPWRQDRRLGAALLISAVTGVVAFGAVNVAKFGSPSALPFDKQVASASPWPSRRAALAAYDGSLFSPRLIPSVAVQTFRPDLVGPTATWPFMRFTDVQPPARDGLPFDTVEPTAGLTVTSPFLLVLAGMGAVAVIRRRRRRRDAGGPGRDGNGSALSASVLRPFVIGGLAATYPPLTIAFIAQRYLADAMPLLIVAGATGAVVLDDYARRRNKSERGRQVVVRGVLVTLALVSVVMTMAVTWSFQRFVSPPDRAARAAGVRTQVAVATVVGSPPEFERYVELPDRAPRPGLAVRGDCLGVYRGNPDGGWDAIEVSARGGDHRLSFRLDARSARGPMAMLALGDEAANLVVAVVVDRSSARVQLFRNSVPGPLGVELEPGGGSHRVEIQADPTTAYVRVLVDGRSVLLETVGAPPVTTATAGRDPFGDLAPLAGTVTFEPTPTPTCDRLLGSGG